ncbi:carboxypeptidase-like regulatory domain-containing protein [Dyadobacter sp. CY356]|uniref:carboxypeptidase-like regulatory domain-containing protein n=1 Tax=Dyadobacter sp. CY356 TaxID=2906442 RepID=UPI001F2A41B7|nr:carboxypeptidase-like regulatory domain-containing protein [Dyadobacter sp. CY356]MCF0058733.1 carboxypeptidase-like regulatory domain-containing protein [Dyadobacter sp. CY356]
MKIFRLSAFLIFILFSNSLYAQKKAFNGRVIDEKNNEPLAFVSVYITNTTIGTITNAKGEFSLMLDPGKYEVIVSMVGYGPIVHPVEIRRELANPPILFKIATKAYALDTVSVLAKRDASWYSNLRLFKDYFLGKSSKAQKCKLLNPDALITVFDVEKQTLTVTAKEPLLIENPELGYKISFLLIAFVMNKEAKYSSYLGYPHFELMDGSDNQKQEWAEKRQQAYLGSTMHFVRSLRDQKLQQEGFRVSRPVEGLSVYAAEASVNGRPRVTKSTRFEDVSYGEYLSFPENQAKLEFKGFLQVVYLREMEDLEYVYSKTSDDLRKASYQTSIISLRDPSVFLQENGSFDKPLGITFEGYWSWDKVGDMLPYDYYPKSE